jgi:aspartyl/asparaginyl-tRNA synthetase
MKKLFALISIILILPAIASGETKIWHAGELIQEVVDKPKIMDGAQVVLEGEIISEPIERKDGCWVNVTDGSIAIGIFFKDCRWTKDIKYWGQHLYKGDTVRIEGRVYKADIQTNGELDIQGTSLQVVQEGYPTAETVPFWKILTASVLAAIALFLVIDRLLTTIRERKAKNENVINGIIDSDDSNHES